MKPSSLDQLLEKESGHDSDALPVGFAGEVLRRAREVRAAAVAHWRILAAGSAVALLLAVLAGVQQGRAIGGMGEATVPGPPPMPHFGPEATELRVSPRE